MTEARVVFTTTGSLPEARRIAHELLDRRLAACVNIVPQVESIYRWEGEVKTDAEWLLIIKTTAARFPQVRDAIQELHSYDLPECIAFDVSDGDPAYLVWIDANTGED